MSTQPAFQKTQYDFTSHIRDPDATPCPEGIEDRRMKIYRELIYNNIESFIQTGFPVLYKLLDRDHWHQMVRDFVVRHQSHSPYFAEISQEFLKYLREERGHIAQDPPFMLELAHYEWVELALDISCETFPQAVVDKEQDLYTQHPVVSPLAWRLSYQYPVHRIGEAYQPGEPPESPTFLVVYRNRADEVKFMEANAVTIRLLQLLEEDSSLSGDQALVQIAKELQHSDPQAVIENGRSLLKQLSELDIICSTCTRS